MPPLSREFLLSRGRCCNNGCINCPYMDGIMEKPILVETIPMDLTNSNDGQGHAWYRTAGLRKAIAVQLGKQGLQRKPFEFPVRLVVTRILGPRQKQWDADSILRGSYKALQDELVCQGWFHDDSTKYITACDGRQDATQRKNGPAVKIEVYKA